MLPKSQSASIFANHDMIQKSTLEGILIRLNHLWVTLPFVRNKKHAIFILKMSKPISQSIVSISSLSEVINLSLNENKKPQIHQADLYAETLFGEQAWQLAQVGSHQAGQVNQAVPSSSLQVALGPEKAPPVNGKKWTPEKSLWRKSCDLWVKLWRQMTPI